MLGKKRLFPQAILRDVQHAARRPDQCRFRRGLCGCGGHVLELECDHGHAAGELADLIEIVIRPHDLDVGHLAGGRVGIRRIRVNAITHPSRGDREHSPELTASQHADGRTWKNRRAGGFVARHGFVRSVELGAAHLGGLLVAILVQLFAEVRS